MMNAARAFGVPGAGAAGGAFEVAFGDCCTVASPSSRRLLRHADDPGQVGAEPLQ